MQNQYGGRNQPTDKPAGTEGQEKVDTAQMSVIGADIVITGNIEASVDLHIEGKIVGDVRCKTLILGESSVIEGRIHCERVRVSGSVNGSIDARDLAVEATAKVAGEIAYERLRVANGGTLEGNVKRKPAEESNEGGKLKLVEPRPGPDAAPAAAAKPAAVFIE